MSADGDRQIRGIVLGLDRAAAHVVTLLTLEITHALIEDCRVDTGWLRANFVPNIGVPYVGLDGVPERVSGAQQAAGQARLAAGGYSSLEQGSVYITNNVPYGPIVDARYPFVEDAIRRGVQALDTGS
jgi:hypothetical protein